MMELNFVQTLIVGAAGALIFATGYIYGLLTNVIKMDKKEREKKG